jgi:hypothetical protein
MARAWMKLGRHTCDAVVDESIRETTNQGREDIFELRIDMDLDGGQGKREAMCKHGSNDPHFLKLVVESKAPLYGGSDLSRLIGTLMLSNTCATHRVTNGFVDELLASLQNSILPKFNHLP